MLMRIGWFLRYSFREIVVAFSIGMVVGCGKSQPTAGIPAHSSPIYSECAVSTGTISIETSLLGSAFDQEVPRSAILQVSFLTAEGESVRAPGLTYSKFLKCDYEYITVGPKRSRYKKVLEVPEGATSVRVAVTRWLHDNEIRAAPLKLNFTSCQIGTKWHMQIVSVWFLLFVGFAFLAYFVVPSKMRPWILLLASIGFYSLFKVWALAFLLVSVLSIWLGGLWLSRQKHVAILSLLVAFNIGILVIVKYLKVAILAMSEFGWCDEPTFSIIVPLGISFYTLQAVSYCWDVYRGTISAEKNFFKLFLYLIFFPTIMQGPISRYAQLGDQLWTPHDFDYDRMKSGLQLMVWGFFKKMVIADRAALLVNSVFAADAKMEGFPVLLGVICYSIQIYTDFSGCVDICRGVSEVLGIDLIQNFQRPYFATSIKDFWRRWHISLSSWLKDYVYIPLGGNKLGAVRKYVNVLLVFAVSGIWHGEGINFFIWGLLHGLYQVLDGLTAKFRTKALDLLSVDAGMFSFKLGQRIMTFVLVSFAWIFFRAPTFADACSVIKRLFVWNPWTWTDGSYLKYGLDAKDLDVLIVSIAILIGVSCLQERGKVREMLARQMLWFRWSIYLLGIGATLIFGIYGPGYAASQFIYMQF